MKLFKKSSEKAFKVRLIHLPFFYVAYVSNWQMVCRTAAHYSSLNHFDQTLFFFFFEDDGLVASL